jgi:general nucleoside transport system permease protein
MSVSLFVASVLSQTTPILLAALAAMFTQRANILNVAVEGMMLAAAMTAVAVGDVTGSVGLSTLAAIAVAVALAAAFGFVSIVLRADFIVAGLGVNLLASGGTLFVLEEVYKNPGGLRPDSFPEIWALRGDWLNAIPVLGPALQGSSFIVVLALALIPLSWVFLYRTPIGYDLRASGEEEHAARAAGIRVNRMKFLAVLMSGVVGGLGGAELSMDHLHFFLPNMTSGVGFIGLAAMLFGMGTPWRTAFAAFLFGVAQAAGDRLQSFQAPPEVVLMVPYLAAILGLVFARLRAVVSAQPAKFEREAV